MTHSCPNCRAYVPGPDSLVWTPAQCPACHMWIVEAREMLHFYCSWCGVLLAADAKLEGRKGLCSKCQHPITVQPPYGQLPIAEIVE